MCKTGRSWVKEAKTILVRGQKFIILEVLLDHLKMAHSSIFEKTGRTEMNWDLRCLRCSPTKQDVLGLIPGRAYFSFSFLFFSFSLLYLYISFVVICIVFWMFIYCVHFLFVYLLFETGLFPPTSCRYPNYDNIYLKKLNPNPQLFFWPTKISFRCLCDSVIY